MTISFTKSKNNQKINTSSKYYGSSNPFHGYAPTCTWYAYGRYYEVQKGSIPSCGKSGINGNGGAFYGFAKAQGKRKTGKTPKVGAIVCWSRSGKYSGQGTAGHVAFVEAVKSGNVITISENYSALGYKRAVYDLKPDSKGRYKYYGSYSTFQGFIYQDSNAASSGGGGRPSSWYIKKYGTGAEVYFALKGYGYSHKACCAVLGNMEQESGIRVYTGGSYDGNGSEGLCQWTFNRKKRMQEYAKKHSSKKTWKSVDGQVAYLVYELQHSESAADKVLKNNIYSLSTMTKEFEKKFERAGVPNMEARVKYAKKWDTRMKGAGDGDGLEGEYLEEQQLVVDMAKRSSQLYSSANYQWITSSQEESEFSKAIKSNQQSIKGYLENLKNVNFTQYTSSGSVSEGSLLKQGKSYDKVIKSANNILPIAQAMVESPFVEVSFAGITIGTYKNSVDDYPNHISSLNIEKINGQINKYEIAIIHQIRPGEDPNVIDKIISSVRYNEITIKYGDFSSDTIYSDTKAIITNVSMNRDYVGCRINYTIYATSAGSLITSYKLNFNSTINKPSNVIHDLLYNRGNTSGLLLEAFPGMKNKSLVSSKNLIPNTDTTLDIDYQSNINPIEYINYLVSCMSNASNNSNSIIRNSTYYISYENDFNKEMGGAYFRIKELNKNTSEYSNLSNNIYEITIGYPDNNYVMGFSVDNDISWSILYNNYNIADEYIYSIDSNGNKIKNYSPNLMSSTTQLNEIQKNWWTQMTTFPINASVTLKGLMKPIMLMDYIIIKVVFYGQEHITSGVYVVTGQKDTLSSDGFRTTLALTRVGSE